MQGGENMTTHTAQYVAVDVSKAMLDIAMLGANWVWRSPNAVAGRSPLSESD
jgi:hypothetical protein